MGRRPEIPHDHVVTGRAFLRSNEFRAGDARRRHDGVVRFEAAARQENQSRSGPAAGDPKKLMALADEPASKPPVPHGPHFYNRRWEWLRIFTDKIRMIFGPVSRTVTPARGGPILGRRFAG